MQMPRNAEYCYALLERLRDYLDMGWMIVGELGPVHGYWSALAIWLCECRPAKLPCR